MSKLQNNFISTYSGIKFYPFDPKPEQIKIDDIAHALSMTPRFGGHGNRFYSVAEHSVYIATYVLDYSEDPELSLYGLLHDASEAYCTDIPSPIKEGLPDYQFLEKNIMNTVEEAFGLQRGMPEIVHDLDKRIRINECRQLMDMGPVVEWGVKDNPLPDLEIECWDFDTAKEEFLAYYEYLYYLLSRKHD